MAAIVITKNETIVFIVSFLFLFAAQSSALVLFAAISLLTLFFLKRKEIYFFWSIIAPRINGEAPILTYLLSLAREEGPGNKELPDLMEIHIPFIPPLIFVFKSEYIKRILNTEPDNFPSDGETGPMAKITGYSGKNILLSPGPPSHHWLRYREITSPINKDRFGSLSLVSEMFQATWSTAQELSKKHLGPKLGQDLNLFYEIFHIMIPAHNRALFGEEFQRKFSYSQQSHDMFDIITETGKQLKFDFCPPTVKKAYFGKLRSVADSVKNMMKESTSKFMKPLLDANRAGKLSDEELFSNVMVFEYAQAPLHVTFWLLYALALHPEEEKRVVSEIANLLAQGPMTYERLPEFKYLSKVVSETLRIYPGVGLMQVRSSKYNTTFGEHFIPQGAYIFLCNYLVQRNATYWSNPDEFIPSREGIDPALYGQNLSYIPFGNGPRQCQGQYFAQDFIKVTVIAILRDYVIRLSPGQKAAEPTEIGFLRPSHPVYVKLEKRILPAPQTPVPEPEPSASVSSSSLARPFTSSSSISSTPLSSSSLSSSSLSRLPTSQSQKKFPPMLNRNKAANLVSQSQVFRDTFVSIGRLKNTKDLLVLYGSQTGNARGLASRVVKMASLCKLHATLTVLSELDVSTVKQYKAVVVVTATYGDGGAPENAEKFENWLEHETSTDIFKGVPYAVLALGSTMYPFPFRFGTFLSRRFAEMGAKQLIPDERIDEIRYHQNEVYTKWSSKLFSALAKNSNVSNLDVSARDLVTKNTMLGFQNFDFNIMSPQFTISFTSKSLKKETRAQYPTKVAFAKVSKNELVNSEPSNEIHSLELSFESGELSFQTGDNVLVYPTNPEDMVERLANRLGFEKDKLFEIVQDENSTVDLSCSQGKNKCTLNIALSYYYDITSPPSSSMLQFLAMNCADTDEQKTLLSYNSNYRSFLTRNYTILDLLENAESFSIEGDKKEEKLAVFLGLLGPIKQRHYSVANFPDSSPNTVRVIYKVVSYTTKEGVAKQGLCTKFLKEKTNGEKIPISIVRAKKFKLPENTNTPIILVGAGSGIAPYFGFLEQRNYQKNNGEQLGKAILVHGCRTEADFAQKDKVETAISEGLLSNLWPAYSRQEGAPKTHIQDIFEQKGEEIWKTLEEGGIVYMCGDISVAVSIRDALVRVAQKHGQMGAFRANTWLSKLSKEGRLRNDEWGITTSSGEHIIRAARLRLWRKSILAILAFSRKH